MAKLLKNLLVLNLDGGMIQKTKIIIILMKFGIKKTKKIKTEIIFSAVQNGTKQNCWNIGIVQKSKPKKKGNKQIVNMHFFCLQHTAKCMLFGVSKLLN